MLCLNLAAGLVDADRRYHGIWAGARGGGNLVAVAQHTRFGYVTGTGTPDGATAAGGC